MNEMVNAVGLDIGAMVIPRAYYDKKINEAIEFVSKFNFKNWKLFLPLLIIAIIIISIAKIGTKFFLKFILLPYDYISMKCNLF